MLGKMIIIAKLKKLTCSMNRYIFEKIVINIDEVNKRSSMYIAGFLESEGALNY